ncbi:putative multifunctional methyltransferase subunit Trm112 [Helianthus anomalus]
MLSTCLSNDSTIVWTQHPFTRGLLRTINCMGHSGDHVFRTTVAVNSKSLVHLEEGALVCLETGRRFPVNKGIPNMLLHEDEV